MELKTRIKRSIKPLRYTPIFLQARSEAESAARAKPERSSASITTIIQPNYLLSS